MQNWYIKIVTGGLACFALASSAGAAALLPYYQVQTFDPSTVIDNPFFPMTDPRRFIYEGSKEEDGELVTERFELTNIGAGPVILGVQTQVQLDRSFEEDLLVEETHDYYAQDTAGNVWYFGEDVTNFVYDDDGNLIDTNNASAWRAGINDALPGLVMPTILAIDFNYFQEYAVADDALDDATLFAKDQMVSIAFGDFSGVLQILEQNQLDPDAREFKYYAPGQGLILVEEGLDESLMNPEISVALVEIVPVPIPAAAWLFGSALMMLGWIRRRAV
jgi:hypothetical protein